MYSNPEDGNFSVGIIVDCGASVGLPDAQMLVSHPQSARVWSKEVIEVK